MARKLVINLLPILIVQLMKMLTPELLKALVDKMLDAIEDAIVKSENKFDDAFLPFIRVIRDAFNIPDNND